MAANIFLSYASKDQKTAETICQALESRGLECWMAVRNIHPGENFQEAIVRAIRSAKVMLFVFSANSNNSDEVKKEIVLAGQHKLFVIPIRVEDVAPNEALAYEFATRQWIDLYKDWESAIEQLTAQVQAVTALVAGGNTTEPPNASERAQIRQAAAADTVTRATTPAADAGPGQPDIEEIYALGNAHAKAGEFDLAIEQYDRVIRLDPDHINALNNRGNAYLAKGGCDQAITDFDKAIALKPDFATAYANRGNAYQDRGEFDRAIRDYGVALQLKPDLAVALDNRAKAYDRKGMHDQARKDRAAALAIRNPAVSKPSGGATPSLLTGGSRIFVIAGGALVAVLLLAIIAGVLAKPKVDSSTRNSSTTDSSMSAASDTVADSSAPSATAPLGNMSVAEANRLGDQAWNSKDYTDALNYYRQAASQGDAGGQNGIGTLYYFGRGGVPQDYSQALKWFQLSAAQGNQEAQNSIGNIYDNGYGVPVNYPEAMKWYQLSANQGNSSGESNVGSLYANGNGVTQDYTEAMRWFRLSAAQGDATGQGWIGYLYANGLGVGQDMAEARRWYLKGASGGDQGSKDWLAAHPA
jgi:TPR repeat protein